MRDASLRAGIGFWNFFNAMPFNGRPDVTESQLRWQSFTSLAFGAKGLLYFCYWSPTGQASGFQWGNALISPRALPGQPSQYLPGPHFFQAARLNAVLGIYGSFLLNATSSGVAFARGPGTGGGGGEKGVGPVVSLTTSITGGANVPWRALVGGFTLPNGGLAALVHNQDTDYPVLLNIVWSGVPLEVDRATGGLAPAFNDAPAADGFSVALEAGDARLFVVAAAQ